ncbi:MAG: AAA family ATPase [Alphaproteobacteria bacterium]|nr:AAA family ATPase [Alphaproteobacteria bacterium]
MKFSYSRVSTFNTCPYQYFLRYVEKVKTFPNDDANNPLYLGTAVHTGLEKTIEAGLMDYLSNYPIISDLQVNETIKLEYVIAKGKELIPDGLFELKVEDDEFVGYMDLLVPKGNNHFDLYDFKYSNNVDNYLKSGQLHVYKYFYEKMNPGHVIDNLHFIFLPKVMIRQKKTENLYQFRKRLCEELSKKEVKIVKVDYDFQKVREYLESVETIKAAVEFPKNASRLCPWCEYQAYCERKDDTMLLPSKERRNINKIDKKVIWIYGAPFSGKTFLANKFNDPLMLNTDGNIRFVDAPFIAIKDQVTVEGRITKRKPAWEVFKEVIDELEKKQNDFKTIVVDLLEDTYEHCRAYEYENLDIDHESDAGFGKGYDIIRKEFLDQIKRLTNLDYENIILISHEDASKNITNKGGSSLTTIRPNIQEKLASKIAGMVDIVGRVVADGENRVLSFKSNELVFGGGRLNVKGKDIPLDYAELMKVYEEANKTVGSTDEQPKQATERRSVSFK